MLSKGKWGVLIVLVAIGAAVLGYFLFRVRRVSQAGPIVSRDTTYLVEPVQADGTIDYVAALNAQYGKGVTPENNAAVPLVQALGSRFYPLKPSEIRRLLGANPLPEDTQFFIPLDVFVRRRQAEGTPATTSAESTAAGAKSRWSRRVSAGDPLEEAQDRERGNFAKAIEKPWKARDYPVLAAWLEANKEPLALATAASLRPRCYVPLVPTQQPSRLQTAIAPEFACLRHLAKAILARAMLRYGSGDLDGSWADAMAAARLARLVGQSPRLFERLLAALIAVKALTVCDRFIRGDALDSARANACLADLKALRPIPDLVETIDRDARFLCLDGIFCAFDSARRKSAQGRPLQPYLDCPPTSVGELNVGQILRRTNRHFDRRVDVLSRPTFAERKEASSALRDEFEAWFAETRGKTPRSATEAIGNLVFTIVAVDLGPTAECFEADMMRIQLATIAMGLAAYRVDHGDYPAELSALSPVYFRSVPDALFTDKPLRYRRAGKGYLLYSVGANMTDDGGESDGKNNDDVAVKIE